MRISAPAQKTIGQGKAEIVPSLIVMNSRGAKSPGTNPDADWHFVEFHRFRLTGP